MSSPLGDDLVKITYRQTKELADEFADAAPRKRRKKTGEKATVEKPACDWMKKRGWYHKKYKSVGSRSAPDRIFAKRGHVIFVEFKKKGKRPTDLQTDEHNRMRKFGLTVWVYDDLKEFQFAIKAYEELHRLC